MEITKERVCFAPHNVLGCWEGAAEARAAMVEGTKNLIPDCLFRRRGTARSRAKFRVYRPCIDRINGGAPRSPKHTRDERTSDSSNES